MNNPVEHQKSATAFFGRQISSGVQLSEPQLRAVEFLERCARELKPLAALTGDAGSGKTVVLNAALARLEGTGRRIVRFSNFVAGPLSMHRTIGASLGVTRASELSVEEINLALRAVLIDAGQTDPPVLAVDDARSLTPETLQYLCMLAQLRGNGDPRFCVLLVGRPGFEDRQEISLLFRLEAVQPEDATQVVRRGFAAAGADASPETVQIFVRHAAGNLRVLDSLMRGRLEDQQRQDATPRASERERRPAPPASPRTDLQRSSRRLWLAVPAFIAIGAAAAAVSVHYGILAKREKTVQLASVSPPVSPRPEPAAPPSMPVPVAQPQARTVAAAPPAVSAAQAPPAETSENGHPPAQPLPATVPTPAVTMPPPAPPIVAPLPAPSLAARTQEDKKPAPAPVVPQPTAPPPVSVAQAAPAVQSTPLTRFRVFNIGPCHQGVCSHWQIFDLDRRKRFVAGLDPSALRLDFDTALKSRLGVVELTVTGFLKANGPAGRILVARSLESVAPHHLKMPSTSTETAGLKPPHGEAGPTIPGGWSKALMPMTDEPSASSSPPREPSAPPASPSSSDTQNWATALDKSVPPVKSDSHTATSLSAPSPAAPPTQLDAVVPRTDDQSLTAPDSTSLPVRVPRPVPLASHANTSATEKQGSRPTSDRPTSPTPQSSSDDAWLSEAPSAPSPSSGLPPSSDPLSSTRKSAPAQ